MFSPPKHVRFFHSKLLLITLQVSHHHMTFVKMEGKTNSSRRLKQFDGLTCLTLTPPHTHILHQISTPLRRVTATPTVETFNDLIGPHLTSPPAQRELVCRRSSRYLPCSCWRALITMLVIDDVTAAGETWRPDRRPSVRPGPVRHEIRSAREMRSPDTGPCCAYRTQSIRRLHRLRRRPGNLVVVTDGRRRRATLYTPDSLKPYYNCDSSTIRVRFEHSTNLYSSIKFSMSWPDKFLIGSFVMQTVLN